MTRTTPFSRFPFAVACLGLALAFALSAGCSSGGGSSTCASVSAQTGKPCISAILNPAYPPGGLGFDLADAPLDEVLAGVAGVFRSDYLDPDHVIAGQTVQVVGLRFGWAPEVTVGGISARVLKVEQSGPDGALLVQLPIAATGSNLEVVLVNDDGLDNLDLKWQPPAIDIERIGAVLNRGDETLTRFRTANGSLHPDRGTDGDGYRLADVPLTGSETIPVGDPRGFTITPDGVFALAVDAAHPDNDGFPALVIQPLTGLPKDLRRNVVTSEPDVPFPVVLDLSELVNVIHAPPYETEAVIPEGIGVAPDGAKAILAATAVSTEAAPIGGAAILLDMEFLNDLASLVDHNNLASIDVVEHIDNVIPVGGMPGYPLGAPPTGPVVVSPEGVAVVPHDTFALGELDPNWSGATMIDVNAYPEGFSDTSAEPGPRSVAIASNPLDPESSLAFIAGSETRYPGRVTIVTLPLGGMPRLQDLLLDRPRHAAACEAVLGSYVAFVNDGSGEVVIYDVADPRMPLVAATLSLGTDAGGLAASGPDEVLFATLRGSPGTLVAYDVRNVQIPVAIGSGVTIGDDPTQIVLQPAP